MWPAGRRKPAGTRCLSGTTSSRRSITPVPRRRPAKLAREVTTLDRLTGGRMILGAGLGARVEDEYGTFGDTTDTKVLAERLDALDLIWSGEPVTYRGNQVTIDDATFLPVPVQRPRVPDAGEVRELVAFLRGCRAENGLADEPFDIVIGGKSPDGAAGRDVTGPLADLGVTWWDERMHWGADLERVAPILNRIEQSPPQL
jgi:hypothetical protein